MSHPWNHAVIANRQPLDPLPTEIEPQLGDLRSVRAVIFDVYGTLVVSGSGDVGVADEAAGGDQILEAMKAVGIAGAPPSIDALHSVIRRSNEQRVSESCPKPEVDIVDCWRETLSEAGIVATTQQCNRLAAEYESRANITWPMPGAKEILRRLADRGKTLGIISNAQDFTLALVEDLAGRFGVDSVLAPDLCVFSNRYRNAKPGPRLFNVLRESLQRHGIAPLEAVYVGNDRLNDIWGAHQAGLRTAWFAGDRRSLRDRRDDPRLADLPHDIVLTNLSQLLDCFTA